MMSGTRRGSVAVVVAAAATVAASLAASAGSVADQQVPNGAVLSVSYDAEAAGPAGTTALGTVHLEDPLGDDLAGVQVALTLDRGFFTDGTSVVEPGTYDPTLTDVGNTLTVSTDSFGDAVFRVSIGRDAGFDDDGLTTQVVAAEVDGLTDSDSIQWKSSDPLNVSEISVVRTPGEPEVASIYEGGVLYDVFTRDQFGNLTAGVGVAIECARELGDDEECPTGPGVVTKSDLDNGGDAIIVSNEAGLFEYTAEAVDPTTFKFDDSLTPQPADPTTRFEQEFYDAGWPPECCWFTIDPNNPSTAVSVGEPITVTVTGSDSEGNPATGFGITFTRTSDPDDQTVVTDANGIAQYVFQGAHEQCGTAETVTAVVREGVIGPIVDTLVTTFTFEKCQVDVSLEGKNSHNNKRDILTVHATSDRPLARTPVVMMTKRDGRWLPVTTSFDRFLNAAGRATFSVKDRNGHRITRYRALLDETDDTEAARSQVLRRR